MRDEQRLLKLLEERWATNRSYQVKDTDSYWRGAFEFPDPQYEGMSLQIEAGLQMTVPMYSHVDSSLYRDEALLGVIEEQIAYLLRSQFPSGCVSLINCNIDSPPDTAFAVHIASMSYHALASVDAPEAGAACDQLKQFLQQTIPCLLNGGVHTPNHRWVICGALALLYEIFPDERLRERADSYLAEGIDINDSGEWTERSNAVYNAVCCNFLYHTARVFGYEELYDPIASNLMMMRYMLHPDGAIVTEYSSRQDRGKQSYLSDEYYIAFSLMAARTGNGELKTLADEAIRHSSNPGIALLYWMRFPQVMNHEVEGTPLPVSYEVLLNEGSTAPVSGALPLVRTSFHAGSPLVRYRNGDLSVTIVSGQPEFLFLQYGQARMTGLRWSLGWFGIAGAPMMQLVKQREGAYELSIELEGSYRGPLVGANKSRSERSDFDFSYAGRDKTHLSKLSLRVLIELEENGLSVQLHSDGLPNIFAQAVLVFDQSGEVAGEECQPLADHLYHQTGGKLIYRSGDDIIQVTGGGAEHRYACLRNDRVDPAALNVICNYMTPMAAELRFTGRTAVKGVTPG
ncbi:hypothetical protein [Paenibacillus daejeonensis]|uniref:hypothetical protein n=1 Tax=Paenibacillus daejeonensis TaxID=135193 RepID=UPI00037CA66B|nr:hypothetical protein [Paenibacillus daejeonensis]